MARLEVNPAQLRRPHDPWWTRSNCRRSSGRTAGGGPLGDFHRRVDDLRYNLDQLRRELKGG